MDKVKNESFNNDANSSYDFKKGVPPTLEKQMATLTHESGKRIGAMASRFADSAADQFRSGREYVVENPAKGVAIAAATGLVAGSLLTLAMRRRPQ